MPEPRTITVTADQAVALEDGKGFTVTLPSNVVTEAEINANFVTKEVHERHVNGVQGRIDSVQKTAQAGARETLMADDGFLEEAIKGRGEFFQTRFPDNGSVDIEKIQNQLRDEEVTPLTTKVDGLTTENATLKGKAVAGDIQGMMAADSSKVMDEHRAMFKSFAEGRVKWGDEVGRPVCIGEDGEVVTKVFEGGVQRPVTVMEWGADLRASGKFDTYFAAKTGPGGNVHLETTTPENIKEQIAAAEKAENWALAGTLKEKQAAALSA